MLCALPELKERYGDAALGVFKTANEDIAKDFPSQASPGSNASQTVRHSPNQEDVCLLVFAVLILIDPATHAFHHTTSMSRRIASVSRSLGGNQAKRTLASYSVSFRCSDSD